MVSPDIAARIDELAARAVEHGSARGTRPARRRCATRSSPPRGGEDIEAGSDDLGLADHRLRVVVEQLHLHDLAVAQGRLLEHVAPLTALRVADAERGRDPVTVGDQVVHPDLGEIQEPPDRAEELAELPQAAVGLAVGQVVGLEDHDVLGHQRGDLLRRAGGDAVVQLRDDRAVLLGQRLGRGHVLLLGELGGDGQAVASNSVMTLVGWIRTTSSPGTPLRLPNSSARSGPAYRAPQAAAVRYSSSGSSSVTAMPWTCTNPNGHSSMSTQSTTRGSRTIARPFAVAAPVLNTISPFSTMNQTGATSGRPSEAVYPSLPVRRRSVRKQTTSSESSTTPDTLTTPRRRRGGNPRATCAPYRYE